MEAVGWFMAIVLGIFVGLAWFALILELVGLPLSAAVAGVRRMRERDGSRPGGAGDRQGRGGPGAGLGGP